MSLKRNFDQFCSNNQSVENLILQTKTKILENIHNNDLDSIQVILEQLLTYHNDNNAEKEEVQYVSKKSRNNNNNSDSNIGLYSPSLGYFQGLPQPILEIIFGFIKNNDDNYYHNSLFIKNERYYNSSFASLRLTCKSFQKLVLPFWHQTIPISSFSLYLNQIEKNQTFLCPSLYLKNDFDAHMIPDVILKKLENLPLTNLTIQFNGPSEINPLMNAISNDYIKIVKLLILHDNPESYLTETPLFLACEKKKTEIVKLLLENGADPNPKYLEKNRYYDQDRDYLPLHAACGIGDTEIVKLLLEYGADPNRIDSFGCTPLYLAATEGYPEIVKLLLQYKADVNKVEIKKYACTPLYATCRGYFHTTNQLKIEIAKLLLENGADPNNLNTNDDGDSPLYTACQNEQLEIVQLLLKYGADPNKTGKKSATPLYIASKNGDTQIVKLLLENGAKINQVCNDDRNVLQKKKDKNNSTPLFIASKKGHIEIVKLLIENGADINIARRDGYTPLSIASKKGHTEVIQLLNC